MNDSSSPTPEPAQLRNHGWNLDRQLLWALRALGADYPTWAEWERRAAPEGLADETWRVALSLVRSAQLRPSGLGEVAGAPLLIAQPTAMMAFFHEMDRAAAKPGGDRGRDRRVARATRREAVASAELAGFATSAATEEALRTGHPPTEPAARAAFNIHTALQRLGEWAVDALTADRVCALHASLMDGLSAPTAPSLATPSAEQLAEICRFANAEVSPAPAGFLHPFTRAVLLHAHVARTKLFADGNGRLARVLFVWALRRAGYARVEELAVSEILLRDRAAFDRARGLVAADGNDATHLLFFLAAAWREAVRLADERGRADLSELDAGAERLRGWADFNPRQQALLLHALKTPETEFVIAVHQRSHGITHETARMDLFDLEARGLLVSRREGRAYRFRAVPELSARLSGRHPAPRPVAASDDAMPVNLL